MLALTRSLTLAWPQVGQLKHTPPLACEPRRGVHFSCPTCGADLLPVSEGVRSLRCSAGHVVDIAREGHLHLLPPKRVKGAVQEARDEVARSTRAFFEHGGFSAQLDGVAAEVVRAIGCCPSPQAGGTLHLLNTGCGEGALLRRISTQLLDPTTTPLSLWGVDDNKLAVRYAAKRQKAARFAVAASHALPFGDGTVDCVCSLFGGQSLSWDESCRVLRPGGAVVVARAGREHLRELRESLDLYRPNSPKEFSAGLAEKYLRVTTSERFGIEAFDHLMAMTPFVRAATREQQARAREQFFRGGEGGEEGGGALMSTPLTVDVIISTHRVWHGTGGGRFEY